MKKTVKLAITKEFEIEIIDELFTDFELEEFSRAMFPAGVNELFAYVARESIHHIPEFIEGIGCTQVRIYSDDQAPPSAVVKVLYHNIETQLTEKRK